MNKSGYSKVEILIIIVLLGIVAFVTINKVSYALVTDENEAFKEVKSLIELQAVIYGENNLELFQDTKTTYINVSDLLDAGYLMANKEGYVTNPSDSSKTLNDNKIKLDYNENNNEISAFLIE